MQPNYGPPDIHTQQFVPIEDSCSSVVFPFSNPSQNQSLNHSIPFTHQLFHHPHRQHFRPPFYHQDHTLHPQVQQPPDPPVFPVNFKLGPNRNGEIDNGLPQPPLPMTPSWHPPQDSTSIKEPFWKQLRGQPEIGEQHTEGNKTKNCKFDENNERCRDLENKHRHFGELEAIYSLAKVCATDQTGSGSALTCENSPKNASPVMPFRVSDGQITATINNGSENSNGEEAASLKKTQKGTKKRKLKENLSSVLVEFIENLVKQVMDHQEMLHKKFLQVIERMEKERREREEERRRDEAEKYRKEAISRAHEQSLASSREAEIVSYLEKITGQSINLPVRKIQLPNKGSSRWPKAEVEALIQARSSIETKFQEPGMMKGHLWEEISSLMVSMGYQRSAKRCKEKWENINKYFKKVKESRKKRFDQSKTCSYFNQLDQLYSVASIDSVSVHSRDQIGSSENSSDPSFRNKKIAELVSTNLEFDDSIINNDKVEQRSHEDEYDMYSDDEDEKI